MPGGSDRIIVGSVGVEVAPISDKFWATFVAKAAPEADRVGQQLGDRISAPIARKISDAIADGLIKGGATAGESGRRAGDDYGGRFATAVRSRIEAAVRALPSAKLGIDTNEADERLAALKAELEALGTKRIGVDIDEATALAELDRIRAELDGLGARSPSVAVKVDAAAASAELAFVKAEVDTLGRTTARPTIDPDTGSAAGKLNDVSSSARDASGSISTLIAVAVALGPTIVPGAAVAAAAIAGIGFAAGAAVAGIGATVLAVGPVLGAVKAMGAAQQQAATSSAGYAAQQVAVANASDQVRSAQASLANTVAEAADAQRRAAEQVANSEQSLKDAQLSALRAQQDLTAARQEAAQQLEDLNLQVADGALAQRQALLDVQKAKQELDATLANPNSSALQRAQAQLTYDQATQQITDLGVRQQRLVDQQRQAQQAGIDGAKQVITAQDQVRQADESVAKAEQSLSDARIAQATQARQSAFQVAQAQQAVISAQRSLQQATAQTASAGGSALDTLKAKMDALSPAGQRFATFLFGLKPALTDLEHSAQEGLLPGLQTGIVEVLPYLPRVTAGIGALSHTVGDLAAEAGQIANSPFWSQFFRFLGGEANQDVVIITHTLEGFAAGAAGTLEGLAPLSHLILHDVQGWAQSFARFGATVGSNAQFQQFIAYATREAPHVGAVLAQVAGAILHIAQAAAPVGGTTLSILRTLAAVISAIPTPVLTILVAGIVAVTAATKALTLAQAAQTAISNLWGKAQQVLTPVVAQARATYASAATATSGYGAAMAAASGSASTLRTGMSGLVGVLGGPVGAATLAAAIGIGAVTTAIVAQRQRVADLAKAMVSLHDALQQAGSTNADVVKSIVDGNDDLQRAIRLSGDYGLSTDSLIRALNGEKDAQDQVKDALNAKIAADQKQFKSFSLSNSGLDQLNRERTLRDALNKTFTQLNDNADANQLLDQAQDKASQTATKLSDSQKALSTALQALGDDTKSTSDKVNALKTAEDAIYGAAQQQADANEAYQASIDGVSNAVDQNGTSLKLNSQAGRDNTDALKAQLKASNDLYFADIAAGVSTDEATAKHEARTKALEDEAAKNGLDAGTVRGLIDVYGQVPTNVKTEITVSGVAEALTQLQQLEIAQLALKQGIDVSQATKEYLNQHKTAQQLAGGLATGGPVHGPGGPTDDLVPALMTPGAIPFRLSNNEHVWTAAEVRAAGGHTAVEAIRRWVLGGKSPQALYPGDMSGGIAFARGGAVRWPFPVTAAMTRIPSWSEVQRVVDFGPDYTDQVTPGIEAAAQFVRAQVGKPYIWAAAGPEGYDCSGLVSAAWLAAHGRNPYSHIFSTYDEGKYFPQPGYGVFTAGWTNPGEPGPGGDNVGHTAGKIGTMPFESVGGLGVRIGSSVTPIGSFAHVAHFDQGGPLMPGLTIAHNGTGQPEFVFTSDQLEKLGGGAGTTVTIPVQAGPGQSVSELAHAVAAEVAWQLR